MTDEVKALVERVETLPDTHALPSTLALLLDLRDCIEIQAREIERLREALEAYAARCTICSGGGSIVEEDSATGALLWRDCPGCTPALAALAGDSHDQ